MADASGTFARIFSEFGSCLRKARKRGILTREHLETTRHRHLRETHSLVSALLVQAAFQNRGREFNTVAVEHALKASDAGQFQPDLTLWSKTARGNMLVGVIEYQSPNSGDNRIWKTDIKEHYHHFIQHPKWPNDIGLLQFWAIITTLPDHKVEPSDWFSWEYKKKSSGYRSLISDPKRFWYERYEREFKRHASCCRKRCPLYLLNLTGSELQVSLPSTSRKVWAI